MDHLHAFTTVFCEHCGMTLSVPVYCKNRFCPTCGHHRNRVIRYKIETLLVRCVLRKFDSFKFLTLTIRNNDDIVAMTTELIESFRKLRQRALWKKHVRGGCCVIEAKKGEGGWHVHLHIILESGFIPVKDLTELWKSCSSGQGVYIKKIHGSQVIGYITKYLTQEKATEKDQKRMSQCLAGRRLFQPFGLWFNIIQQIPKLKFPCPACNSVHWFYGSRDAWFRSSYPQTILDDKAYERLPPNNKNLQCNLDVDSLQMPMNVD